MRHVILFDSQDITRIGMGSLISEIEKTSVVKTVSDKSSLIKLLISQPDALIVLDYTLSDFASADEVLNVNARFPKTHWLLFSEELSADLLKRMMFSSESISVVLKMCDLDEIDTAIIHTFRNERFVCSRVMNQLLMANKTTANKSDNGLTTTETEILKEMALGRTTKEIAAKRNLSFHTIITHRKNIFRKLEVNNVHEATKYAIRAGIIDMSDYYI